MRYSSTLCVLPLIVGLSACASQDSKVAPTAQSRPVTTAASAVRPTTNPATSPAAARPAPAGAYRSAELSGDYAGYASTKALIDHLEHDFGFERTWLNGVFSRIERQKWILDYLNRPKGTGTPRPGSWTRYRAKFLTTDRISRGLRFWDEHVTDLERAQGRYGVPPEFVAAIIGVETHYGSNVGSHKVIEALATLAFDYPRRADFFTEELVHFLEMSRNEGFDPFEPVGSYAGAMGLGQFMPSSFHEFAVDFDDDGRRDLWNPVDAIGSVANYFAGHGWHSGEPVAFTAVASGREPGLMKAGYTSSYSPAALAGKGVRASQSLQGFDEVSLIRLDTLGGPEYWVGLHNFYVITRYNHSTYYAMAVYQLAQALRDAHDRPAGPVMSFVPAEKTVTLNKLSQD